MNDNTLQWHYTRCPVCGEAKMGQGNTVGQARQDADRLMAKHKCDQSKAEAARKATLGLPTHADRDTQVALEEYLEARHWWS